MTYEHENIGTIVFIYCVPSSLMGNAYEQVISSSLQLHNDYDRYGLIGIEDHPLFHICTPPQIMYDDLSKFPDQDMIWEAYHKLMYEYGPDTVDKYIVQDTSPMEKKILNTLVFAMDTMYKSDNIMIKFMKSVDTEINGKLYRETSGISNLLYSVIQENFTIIDQNLIDNINYVHIKKRSE